MVEMCRAARCAAAASLAFTGAATVAASRVWYDGAAGIAGATGAARDAVATTAAAVALAEQCVVGLPGRAVQRFKASTRRVQIDRKMSRSMLLIVFVDLRF
jgi:hypothetical protein